MVDTCTCSNGFSSKRQLFTFSRHSFPKRLLVAISIAIIITMCVMPTEARSVVHKRKHKYTAPHAHSLKDVERIATEHKWRHHNKRMLENLTQQKRRPKMSYNAKFHFANRKIVNRLKNTKFFLKQEKDRLDKLVLSELRGLSNTITKWVPRVNFVMLHFHDFKNESRHSNQTVPELRFKHLMPKLYKSLLEYEKVFERLLSVKMDIQIFEQDSYRVTRLKAIRSTLEKLRNTIEDVRDYCNCSDQGYKKKQIDLSTLALEVDWNRCKQNDYIAFKAYSNFLNNWLHELQCRGRSEKRPVCKKYLERLRSRKQVT